MARLGRGIPTNASSRAGPFGEPPPSYSSVVVDPLPGKANYSFEGCCSDTILWKLILSLLEWSLSQLQVNVTRRGDGFGTEAERRHSSASPVRDFRYPRQTCDPLLHEEFGVQPLGVGIAHPMTVNNCELYHSTFVNVRVFIGLFCRHSKAFLGGSTDFSIQLSLRLYKFLSSPNYFISNSEVNRWSPSPSYIEWMFGDWLAH